MSSVHYNLKCSLVVCKNWNKKKLYMRAFFFYYLSSTECCVDVFFLKGRGTTKPDTGYKVAGTAYTHIHRRRLCECVFSVFFSITHTHNETFTRCSIAFWILRGSAKSANKQKSVELHLWYDIYTKKFFF